MVTVKRLLDRDRELAAIRELLDRAWLGDGGMLLIEGPFGVGKSALLDTTAELASGFRVLRGRGGEIERDMSFGLVRELFEPALRAADAPTRALARGSSGPLGGCARRRNGPADRSRRHRLRAVLAACGDRRERSGRAARR